MTPYTFVEVRCPLFFTKQAYKCLQFFNKTEIKRKVDVGV